MSLRLVYIWGVQVLKLAQIMKQANLLVKICDFSLDLVYFLPCRHNYQHKFCFDNYRERFCKSAEEDGAHVIHGSANTFYNQYAPPFRIINNVMTQVLL